MSRGTYGLYLLFVLLAVVANDVGIEEKAVQLFLLAVDAMVAACIW